MIVNYDPKIDAYILQSKDFAQPILNHLRNLVHRACPNVIESIKWGMPAFDFHGPLCNMAAFKAHAVFGFWKTALIDDPYKCLQENSNKGGDAMGNLGRITHLNNLPPDDQILEFIAQAMNLNVNKIKTPLKPKLEKLSIEAPLDLMDGLGKNKIANAVFMAFSPSNKREYITWLNEAKTFETRNKRLNIALEWIAEGKIRNWKYVVKKTSSPDM